jgi:hypothetical protein
MARAALLALLFAALTPFAGAADEVIDLLPPGLRHDPSLPTPEAVMGFEPGRWHVRPELIDRYIHELAEASDRVTLIPYGASHEARPLTLVAITSPDNQARLDDLRVAHVARVKAGDAPGADDPIVVWLGYSVHGNEPSGANAASVVAWHLASGLDDSVTDLLDHAIVLIDPVINPDGLARFAHWANSHRGATAVADGGSREHNEAWPGGRTNHYWFDLNRDWLLLTHPESQGRVAQYHRWRPTVLGDFHEMGTGSTFFFQPGVPSRQNPLTPEGNLELTRAIAEHHAAAFDAIGQLYYSEESFDDFYYGKGSTYPDVLGAIGILFEQASSRGHLQQNAWGPLPFELTIRNQVRTSLSTLAAARGLRGRLLTHQSDSTASARTAAADSGIGGWIVGDARDPARSALMADLLLQHDLDVYELGDNVNVANQDYEPGTALWIPHDQPNGRLAHALFETRLEFPDDTFYDVSTWTLPLALGLPFAELALIEVFEGVQGPKLERAPEAVGTLQPGERRDTYAYAFRWRGLHVGRALQRIHAAGALPMVATRPLAVMTPDGVRPLDPGAIVIPAHQDLSPAELLELMGTVAREDGLEVLRVTTGLTPGGIDLGSPSMRPLDAPRVALVVGSGTSSYEAGEIWHHLDLRMELPVTLVEGDDLGRLDLADYTHVVLVSGASSQVDEDTVRSWVREGGVLVATSSSARWAARELLGLDAEEDDRTPETERAIDGAVEDESDSDEDDDEGQEEDVEIDDSPPTYAEYEGLRAKSLVSGAIFAATVDDTHPLTFGMGPGPVHLFRRGTEPLPAGSDPFARPLVYTGEPLVSGYASDQNVEELAGTPAALARRLGGGTVIMLADDPVFRGVWHGSARLLENAIHFGGVVKRTSKLDEHTDESALDEH